MAPNSLDLSSLEATKVRGHNLDDFIWMEILSRLPSTKLVFQCKCVSKHWNCLISDQYFVGRFIDHNRENYKNDFDADQLLLFFNCWHQKHQRIVASWGRDHDGTKRGLILPITNYRVECSFNDLLVCSENKSSYIVFHIVNPFTKEHVELPMPDLDVRCNWPLGFVCEPFYSRGGRQFGLTTNYRYRVVRILVSNLSANCRVETYSSETREWSVRAGLDIERFFWDSNIAARNGKFYWLNLNSKVVVYDPFVATDEPCFNFLGCDKTPLQHHSSDFNLAQSQGSLLLMQFREFDNCTFMSIWKLGKEKHGDCEAFCFERSVIVNHIVSLDAPSFIRREVDKHGLFTRVLGVDPSNQNVIFLGCDGSPHIASYNLETKEWLVVGEMQRVIDHHCSIFFELGITATLPWWPTPVH